MQSATRRIVVLLGIALAICPGIGLARPHDPDDRHSKTHAAGPNSNIPRASSPSYAGWQPAVGTAWQIELLGPLSNTNFDVEIFDVDLFDNAAATIAHLHTEDRKVICYFSAGSYEDWRPDEGRFHESDKGKALADWKGESWLDTNSENVRSIMLERLDLAAKKGCDGVDPDNVDAYNNDNGLGLTTEDAEDYVKFLANEAHDRNLSIGLKNAGEIIPQVEPQMQWSVNEQCVEHNDECGTFQAFINNGKPVFHIEYPRNAPNITDEDKKICNKPSVDGFSTLLKKLELDEPVMRDCGNRGSDTAWVAK
ncbi:MAG: hypothetical protein Q9209_006475 [Squamulea sp. 1 TL-2023]